MFSVVVIKYLQHNFVVFFLLSFLSVGFPVYVMADSLIYGQVTAIDSIGVFGFQNALATLNDVTLVVLLCLICYSVCILMKWIII